MNLENLSLCTAERSLSAHQDTPQRAAEPQRLPHSHKRTEEDHKRTKENHKKTKETHKRTKEDHKRTKEDHRRRRHASAIKSQTQCKMWKAMRRRIWQDVRMWSGSE